MTLRELERYWTLDDVLDAHAALDALDEAEAKAADQIRNETQTPR